MELKGDVAEVKGKRRKWVKPLAGAALLGLFILLIAVRLNAKKDNNTVVQEKLQPVEVASVMARALAEELSIAGTITPFTEARLSPRVMGRVSSVYVNVGQRVRQGETLLTIEQSDYFTALKQAEANLAMATANSIQAETGYENARLNYQRNEDLYNQGAVSKSQLEGAKGQLAAAESAYKANQAQILQFEAMLEKARADYSNTEVKAPFPA